METIEQKVRNALTAHFAGEEIRFDHEPDERVSGFIVSDKFLDMDHEARQGLIWGLLRAHLSKEERQEVLGFLAYTPAEEKFYLEAYQD